MRSRISSTPIGGAERQAPLASEQIAEARTNVAHRKAEIIQALETSFDRPRQPAANLVCRALMHDHLNFRDVAASPTRVTGASVSVSA